MFVWSATSLRSDAGKGQTRQKHGIYPTINHFGLCERELYVTCSKIQKDLYIIEYTENIYLM